MIHLDPLSPSRRRVGLFHPRAVPDPRGRYLEISEANSAGKPAAALFPSRASLVQNHRIWERYSRLVGDGRWQDLLFAIK